MYLKVRINERQEPTAQQESWKQEINIDIYIYEHPPFMLLWVAHFLVFHLSHKDEM